MQTQRVSHVILFWKSTSTFAENPDICRFKPHWHPNRTTQIHTNWKQLQLTWGPRIQWFPPDLKMTGLLNIVTTLHHVVYRCWRLSAPVGHDRMICNTRPAAINSNALSSFSPFFFTLCRWRVVLTHATLIISHSDIQMSTEQHHSHMCSWWPEYIKGQLAWKWPLFFLYTVK